MQQLSLFDLTKSEKITNVATVPQRSPFRYPGGKTWLIPRIRQWLLSREKKAVELVEPFAGGGIVSLTVAFENLAERVTMLEIDEEVAAVWQAILQGDAKWLGEKIVKFKFCEESVNLVLSKQSSFLEERAFQTLIKNRVNRGGILAAGAGRIKSGENQKGLSSRWYPETLQKRILNIFAIRHRFNFIQGDGMEFIKRNAELVDRVFFIDPPYTAAGKKAGSRLYNYWEIDHEDLFKTAADIRGDFLMTYENSEVVRQLAYKYGFDMQPVAMKNTHHAKMTELLISRNLDWCR
jgi:DNA adenine methylase